MAQTYIVGNWKMNHGLEELQEFFEKVAQAQLPQGNFWIAPQPIHIQAALSKGPQAGVKVGAQNCSERDSGAFTGETSPLALAQMGASFVILGHSERRAIFQESDQTINAKVKAAMKNGLIPILCVGETLEEREAGRTMEVVLGQLRSGLEGIAINAADALLLAYEPVWAIGTGKTASPEQAEEVHAAIRATLKELYPEVGNETAILYGGSVKPSNINGLLAMPNVNGGLVGGASLKAQDFIELCKAAN